VQIAPCGVRSQQGKVGGSRFEHTDCLTMELTKASKTRFGNVPRSTKTVPLCRRQAGTRVWWSMARVSRDSVDQRMAFSQGGGRNRRRLDENASFVRLRGWT